MAPTDREQATFEAGIKFGTLYHQFVGTPVSPDSADSLATAMEEAIENQPFCRSVTVTIHEDRLAETIQSGPDEEGGYTELTGEYMTVTMTIERDGTVVETRMELDEEGYPLMAVEDVRDTHEG